MCLTKKNKLTGSIFIKKWAKSAKKCPTRKKKSDSWNFFFILFPPLWLKNPCQDSWTKEYGECCLIMVFCETFAFNKCKEGEETKIDLLN